MECCKKFVKKQFKIGDTICAYGRAKQMVGVMEEGEAKLMKIHSDGRQVALEYYGEDSIFGEAFAAQGEYMDELRIICTKDAVIAFISYENLLHRCEKNCPKHGEIIDAVLRQLADRSVRLNERVQVLTQPTIREKLRCFFQFMEARCNRRTFDIPYSYTELAEYLSVDRSAMMRELKNMEEEGDIKREKRRVKVTTL